MQSGSGNDTLQVKTFGGFSLIWQGTPLIGGSRSGESQIGYLLQLLLHNRKDGVSREKVEELLFVERDIENIHHALRSVIYNAKRKLRQAGLPEVNYIEMRKGIVYWTDQIPVSEDAQCFEELYEAAGKETDSDRQLELYLEAIHLYKGEFLPTQAGIIWVAQEAKRYRGMFCSCMENVLPLLRLHQNFAVMEELGRYAVSIQPLADWETVLMEALVSQGRYREAQQLYDDTVEYYSQEQGLRPSKKLSDLLSRLGTRMLYQFATLDEIQKALAERPDEYKPGGYLCPYPVFQGIYRVIERLIERGGQFVYLMLCTVVDGKGNPMKDGAVLDDLSPRLEEAIQGSVRHSDVVCRYGKGQYLVLLINTTRENCKIIQKRINQHFIIGRQRIGIQYYVNSVVSTFDGEKF